MSQETPVNVSTFNDQAGTATVTVVQPSVEVIAKRVVAGIVGVAGVLVSVLPDHTLAFKIALGIVGFGAALGITSRGVAPKQ